MALYRKFYLQYLLLIVFYLIPLLALSLLLVLFLSSILSLFLIPYIAHIDYLSPRSTAYLNSFLFVNLISNYQIFKAYRKTVRKKEQKIIYSENKLPPLFFEIIRQLKKELVLEDKVSITIHQKEFLIYANHEGLIVNIPLLSLLVLTPDHLKEILHHEFLHFKQWDTSFDKNSARLFSILDDIRKYLELRSVSTINPIYWLIRAIGYFQKKIYHLRKEISESIIDQKLKNQIYDQAIVRVYLVDLLNELVPIKENQELPLIEFFKKAYSIFFSLQDSEISDYDPIKVSDLQSGFLQLSDHIDWDKVCYNDKQIQQIYIQQEIEYLTALFYPNSNPVQIADNKEQELVQEFAKQPIIEKIDLFFQKLKISPLQFCMNSVGSYLTFISQTSGGNANEWFIVQDIPKEVKEEAVIANHILKYGKEARAKYPHHTVTFCFILLDNLDSVSINSIAKMSNRYFPSSFLKLISMIFAYLPIKITCGGVIPIFITKETSKLYYRAPIWSIYKKLVLFGMKNIWREVNDDFENLQNQQKQVLNKKDPSKIKEVQMNKKAKIRLGILVFLFILGVYTWILHDQNELTTLNFILMLGILFFISGGGMLLYFYYPLLYNQLLHAYTFGQGSVKFDSIEEKELFVNSQRKNAVIKKSICFLMMAIGIVLIAFSLLI